MKAIIQDKYGSHDVLELRDVPKPEVGEDDVLLRVHAAGVDPSVWHIMTGLPYAVRLAYGLRVPKVRVRGMDVAGLVDAVGGNGARFHPADEGFGGGDRAFAQHPPPPHQPPAPEP